MLRWSPAHDGSPIWHGHHGPYFVAQVVRYDVPAGWVGFIRGQRVTGEAVATAVEAERLVERAWPT